MNNNKSYFTGEHTTLGQLAEGINLVLIYEEFPIQEIRTDLRYIII